MAEFIEVMRQARRMCNSFGGECSDKCPLNSAIQVEEGCYRDLCICVCGGYEEAYKLIEERVMQWATAHPAPVYPSWNEWYRKNFPDAYYDGKRMCPRIFGGGADCDSENDCDKCRDWPIPADIAAKLGIKPKEHDNETQCV